MTDVICQQLMKMGKIKQCEGCPYHQDNGRTLRGVKSKGKQTSVHVEPNLSFLVSGAAVPGVIEPDTLVPNGLVANGHLGLSFTNGPELASGAPNGFLTASKLVNALCSPVSTYRTKKTIRSRYQSWSSIFLAQPMTLSMRGNILIQCKIK